MEGQGQDIKYKAGEATGLAQVKKDEMMNQASNTAQATQDKASQMAQSTKASVMETKDQTGGFLQQTGEQVMNVAQGAAETVKNTLGMNNTTTNTGHPSNPTNKM